MNKNIVFKWFLALTPVSAFFLATTGGSVTVYDISAQQVGHLSYFALVEGVPASLLLPLSGFLTAAASVLALVLVLGKKQGCCPWLKWISLIAACLAVAPMFMTSDVRVVPNFLLPLLMMVEYVLCRFASGEKIRAGQETRGNRLG